MAHPRTFLLLMVLGAVSIGCGSQPIPMMAVEGTTITVALPGDFEVGFGRAWVGQANPPDPSSAPAYDHSNPDEDLQRGEMVFTLKDQGAGTPNPDKILQVLYITRVNVDRASERVVLGESGNNTQVIALLNLPVGLVDGDTESKRDYTIHVERHRRVGTGGFAKVDQGFFFNPTRDWTGWGETNYGPPEQEIPIEIADAPEAEALESVQSLRHTPREGWGPQNREGIGQQVRTQLAFDAYLDRTVPHPEFRVSVPESVNVPPAAYEIEIGYPAKLINPLGVRALKSDTSGAAVLWSVDDSVDTTCSSADTGTLTVNVADPVIDNDTNPTNWLRGAARGVAVVFELINLDDCEARIIKSDIDIVSVKEYDQNGVLQTSPAGFALVHSDFN